MKTSEQVNELTTALAKAQGAFVNPDRNRTVKVTTKSGGSYSFAYATLDNIINVARKPLADNGLSITQNLCETEQGKLRLETTLWHASGQWLRTELPVLVTEHTAQSLGSAVTYAKRYAITALLGIAADEDDDGNVADGNTIQDSRYRNGNGAKQMTPREPAEKPATEKAPRVPPAFWTQQSYVVKQFKAAGELAEKIGILADEAPDLNAIRKVRADNGSLIANIADTGLRDRIEERLKAREEALTLAARVAA